MKLCINCVHFRAAVVFPDDSGYHRCARIHPISPVDGKKVAHSELPFCYTLRRSNDPKNCGHEAQYFEETTHE